MNNQEAELMKLYLQAYTLETRRNRQSITDTLNFLTESFPALPVDIQEVILEILDEFAQQTVRDRDMYDNTIAKLKKVQAGSDE